MDQNICITTNRRGEMGITGSCETVMVELRVIKVSGTEIVSLDMGIRLLLYSNILHSLFLWSRF